MSTTAPTFERINRVARELAEIVKESGQPDETLSDFVSVLTAEHGIDVRAVKTFAERWEEGKKWTEEQVRAYLVVHLPSHRTSGTAATPGDRLGRWRRRRPQTNGCLWPFQ